MEHMKISAVITPAHDITEVVAKRFSSIEEFGINEPNYLGTVIGMGELPWLCEYYNSIKRPVVEVSPVVVEESASKAPKARKPRASRVSVTKGVDGDEVKPSSPVDREGHMSARKTGRGPKVYTPEDISLQFNLDDAIGLRKEGEVTMKVHVPHTDILPMYFNTKYANVGPRAEKQRFRSVMSSARREFAAALKELDCPVRSNRISVCRAMKNKKAK